MLLTLIIQVQCIVCNSFIVAFYKSRCRKLVPLMYTLLSVVDIVTGNSEGRLGTTGPQWGQGVGLLMTLSEILKPQNLKC